MNLDESQTLMLYMISVKAWEANKTLLTLNAELLLIVSGNIRGDPNPPNLIKSMIINLIKKEGDREVKNQLIDLYENNY